MTDLSYNGFRAWLERQPGDSVVGMAGRPSYCPLANYIYDAFRIPASIASSAICVEDARQPLPLWAKRFVSLCDARQSDDDAAILAAEALDILAACRPS